MNSHSTQPVPVINHEVALQRLGGDTSLFATLASFFLEDAPGLMEQLHDAYRTGAAELVVQTAHSLKGLSATFEAIPFRRLAEEIEFLARAGNLSTAGALLTQIDHEFGRLVTSLRPSKE